MLTLDEQQNQALGIYVPSSGTLHPSSACLSERARAAGAHGSSLGIEMLHVLYSSFHSAVCNVTESLRLRTETTASHWLITDPLVGGFVLFFVVVCLIVLFFFSFYLNVCFFPMVVFKIVLNRHKRKG